MTSSDSEWSETSRDEEDSNSNSEEDYNEGEDQEVIYGNTSNDEDNVFLAAAGCVARGEGRGGEHG